MILNFYVSGQPPGATAPVSETSYFDSLMEFGSYEVSVLSDLTLEKVIAWIEECTATAKERAKRAFKYLSGAPLPPPATSLATPPDLNETDKKGEASTWSFAGMFSSLKGPRGGVIETHPEPDGRVWTDGEVHADLIRVHILFNSGLGQN
jgi:import inner membrane translocase subunit TIM21